MPCSHPCRYIRLGTCTSFLLTWLGLGPMQIMFTATTGGAGTAGRGWGEVEVRGHVQGLPSSSLIPPPLPLHILAVWELLLSMPSSNPCQGSMLLHDALQKFAW